jgi:6-phosphogluconolactonase
MIVNCVDASSIAPVVARRLLELEGEGPLRVALTGGTLGIEVIAELGKMSFPVGKFRFVFGDERFVPRYHPDRNEAQGLAVWPELESVLLRYPEVAGSLESARERFEAEFESWLDGCKFDLVILGMGPDGHVASLFPGAERSGALVIAEPESPKPPSQRLSLSYSALSNSERVWFVVSGAAKAEASACSYRSACDLPAARVRGTETVWFVDDVIAEAIS